jgi:hypothetical protein
VNCDMSMVYAGPPIFSTNNTDHHDITDILLKVAINTIKQTNLDNRASKDFDVLLLTLLDPNK